MALLLYSTGRRVLLCLAYISKPFKCLLPVREGRILSSFLCSMCPFCLIYFVLFYSIFFCLSSFPIDIKRKTWPKSRFAVALLRRLSFGTLLHTWFLLPHPPPILQSGITNLKIYNDSCQAKDAFALTLKSFEENGWRFISFPFHNLSPPLILTAHIVWLKIHSLV